MVEPGARTAPLLSNRISREFYQFTCRVNDKLRFVEMNPVSALLSDDVPPADRMRRNGLMLSQP